MNCAGKNLCGDKKCNHCFKRSFASIPKSKYWSDKNLKTPYEVFKSDSHIYIFNCDCGHSFETKACSITDGHWCPFCSHLSVCKTHECKMCFENSFASIENSKYLSVKNNKKAREYLKNSDEYAIFDCPNCNNEYNAQIKTITFGSFCNCIKNKTETKLYNFLKESLNYIIEKEKKLNGVLVQDICLFIFLFLSLI